MPKAGYSELEVLPLASRTGLGNTDVFSGYGGFTEALLFVHVDSAVAPLGSQAACWVEQTVDGVNWVQVSGSVVGLKTPGTSTSPSLRPFADRLRIAWDLTNIYPDQPSSTFNAILMAKA